MAKKYSIVINNVGGDVYAMVVNSFDIDEDGNRINVETEILNNLSFEDVKQKVQSF
jgi:hypothetical protein